MPGATVTVRNVGTNGTAATTSDDSGRFAVSPLPPGTYSVEIARAGFASYKQDNVVVEVGRLTPLEATLGVSGQIETIVVFAELPVEEA